MLMAEKSNLSPNDHWPWLIRYKLDIFKSPWLLSIIIIIYWRLDAASQHNEAQNAENTKITSWPLIWRKGQSAGCQKLDCVKRQMKKDDLLMRFPLPVWQLATKYLKCGVLQLHPGLELESKVCEVFTVPREGLFLGSECLYNRFHN